MRALFYNHSGRASGAERVLTLALQHLDRTAVEPRVVCPDGDLATEVEALGIPVSRISELRARFTILPHKLAIYAFSLFRTGLALRTEIKRAGAEIVHANSPRAGIAALFATAGSGMPVIWHVHDELKPHLLTTIIRFLAGASNRCSIIAVSAATAKSFVGNSTRLKGRVKVIHNAVDVAAIDEQTSTTPLREELDVGTGDFLFGIVGQITPRKGQLELVEAFARIATDLPNARLLVIGSPIFNDDHAYHQTVVQRATSLGLTDRVLFLGQRSDATSLIKQLDTLIINSKSEAFVMVAIEAMACRTPVIATNVGGTAEMVHDGVNGRLLSPGDESALVSAMLELARDQKLRDQFVDTSRSLAESELNVDRFADEFHCALRARAEVTTANCPVRLGHVNSVENP